MPSNLERIKAEAMQELAGDDDAALGQLWNKVYAAFDQWKQEHGNRKPKAYRRMLSDWVGAKSIPFKKAAPWQCADFQVPAGPIALAIKLMRENYRPLWAIMDQEGIRKVVAMLIVGFGDDAIDGDLLTMHVILRDHKTAEAMGHVMLQEHRAAIIAHSTRPDGGNIRGKQQTAEKGDRHDRIRKAEKALPATTRPHHVNKLIHRAIGLPIDYVRKARKEMKRETDGS